jgi:hypothetical protein
MIPYIDSTSSYLYSVITDFGGNISPACLHQEIYASSIGSTFVVIHFTDVLSGPAQTILDALVATHDPYCNLGDSGIAGVETTGDGPQDGDIIVYDSTAGEWITYQPGIKIDSPEDFWASLGYNRIQSDGVSSTTSTTFQNKTSVSYTNDSSATQVIRVGYTAEFNAANNNKATEVELYEVVNAIQLANSVQQTNAATNWFVFAGFHLEFIPAGESRTFQINFRVVPGLATTCSIRAGEIELWRIV